MMVVDEVELTHTQAKGLAEFAQRAHDMYKDRQGGGEITNKLRPLITGLNKIVDGERDFLRLGLGMRGDDREELIAILKQEYDMEERKNRQDWGMDGRKLKAIKRGLKALEDPETVKVEMD